MSVLFISCDATQEDKDLERFSQVLSKKIEKSESRMSDLQYLLEQGGIEAIDFSPLTDKEDDIFYYVYKNDSLVFWTENEIGVPLRFYHGNWSSPLVFFPHTDVVRMLYIADDFTILSLIKLKDNYDEKLLSLPANQSLLIMTWQEVLIWKMCRFIRDFRRTKMRCFIKIFICFPSVRRT